VILVDTHVLVWLDSGSARLGSQARATFDRALTGDRLAVAAISFWEVGMLVVKGRLSLALDPARWRLELLRAGLIEVAIGGEIALRAATLERFHGDPVDRLIVATALGTGATLYTADTGILDWSGPLLRGDAAV
jgi:PIN domain nuclease of toxin-antitoxin system